MFNVIAISDANKCFMSVCEILGLTVADAESTKSISISLVVTQIDYFMRRCVE